jgi:5'-3' exonuclease
MRTPIKRMDEYALLNIGKSTLVSNWSHNYYYSWFGYKSEEIGTIVNMYIDGLYWVLDYYTGKAVDPLWYYPWNLPPLMTDLEKHYRCRKTVNIIPNQTEPISPVEQCALVMPAVSMHLCADKRLQSVVKLAPHYFPMVAKFFYVGKRHMWECEPLIPIMTIHRLRSLFR